MASRRGRSSARGPAALPGVRMDPHQVQRVAGDLQARALGRSSCRPNRLASPRTPRPRRGPVRGRSSSLPHVSTRVRHGHPPRLPAHQLPPCGTHESTPSAGLCPGPAGRRPEGAARARHQRHDVPSRSGEFRRRALTIRGQEAESLPIGLLVPPAFQGPCLAVGRAGGQRAPAGSSSTLAGRAARRLRMRWPSATSPSPTA